MKTNKWTLVASFLAGSVVGGAGLYVWHLQNPPCMANRCGPSLQGRTDAPLQTLQEADWRQAALPEGVQEANPVAVAPESSVNLPSQLVRSTLPDDIILGGQAEASNPEQKPAGVVLSDGQNTVVLNAQKPAQRAAEGTSITMIEAPVELKKISSLEAYKTFKRTARGSYPAADFNKQEVVVLESASNLPDKVFEIVSIDPEGEGLKLRYRVNVFGLDRKTNTHSVQVIDKTQVPIVLEQVL